MINFKKLFFKPTQKDITLDEAIQKFLDSPCDYFERRRAPYDWPLCSPNSQIVINLLPDLSVKVGNHVLGFVEGAEWHSTAAPHAVVRHIAVAKGLSGRGIGPALAKAYCSELQKRYKVKKVVFSERSTQYETANYAQFFQRMGAIALPIPRGGMPNRPDFELTL